MGELEGLRGAHHPAAAAAAVADVADPALHVVGRLREPGLLAALQDPHPLGGAHRLGVAAPDQRLGPEVERHAGSLRAVARRSEVLGVVAAGAESRRRRCAPFSTILVARSQSRTSAWSPFGSASSRTIERPTWTLPPEDRPGERSVLVEEVALEELRELPGGGVLRHPHERELEEADDDRGERGVPPPSFRSMSKTSPRRPSPSPSRRGRAGGRRAGPRAARGGSKRVGSWRARSASSGLKRIRGSAEGRGVGRPGRVPVQPLLEQPVAPVGVDEVVPMIASVRRRYVSTREPSAGGRRRPASRVTLRPAEDLFAATAIARRSPTRTTSFFPRVTAV